MSDDEDVGAKVQRAAAQAAKTTDGGGASRCGRSLCSAYICSMQSDVESDGG